MDKESEILEDVDHVEQESKSLKECTKKEFFKETFGIDIKE